MSTLIKSCKLSLRGTVGLPDLNSIRGTPGRLSETIPIVLKAYTGGILQFKTLRAVFEVSGFSWKPPPMRLLYQHNRQAGVIEDIDIDGDGNLVASGRLEPKLFLAARLILSAAHAAKQWQASIEASSRRYSPLRLGESIEVNGRTFTKRKKGALYVVRAALLTAISIVDAGADVHTSVELP